VLSCISFIPQKSYSQEKNYIHYQINYSFKENLPDSLKSNLHLTTTFTDQSSALKYLYQLPNKLAIKGFPAASVDQILSKDSIIDAIIYLGKKFVFVNISKNNLPDELMNYNSQINHLNPKQSIPILELTRLEEYVVNYYENNGYPFANLKLDSIFFKGEVLNAKLILDKGIYYKIDSIRIWGDAKISNSFLQKFLDIRNNTPYKLTNLKNADFKIKTLTFLKTIQPADVSFLGTGAVFNLYLQNKKSNQFNFLIGLQPSNTNTQKIQLTGDVNLQLKNMFSKGESINLKWQQLQFNSPRLNWGYVKPYIFNSDYTLTTQFELFKKASDFLNVKSQLGMGYDFTSKQSTKVFLQWQSCRLLSEGIDTNLIKSTKKLPVNIDFNMANIGFGYEWNTTNYRLNPIKGNEITLTTTAGTKKIKENNQINALKLTNANLSALYDSIKLNSYQVNVKMSLTHFFQVGKQSTIKTTLNGGYYNSSNIFRNEIFQIGGFQLLRGFDEESIYATRYAVISAEFRQLFNENNYLSFFSDYGSTKLNFQDVDINHHFISAGIGLVYETKTGLLNVIFAMGKRDDVAFNIRNAAKIHFGFVNYF
jgi:hemolysin activation/secretion protein